MNEMETRLAELFKERVGDPPSRVTVQAVRHQRARRQVAAAVGAAAALALIGTVSVGLIAHFGSAGPAVGPALPAGVPRYYVEEAAQGGLKTVVRATATGRVTATIRCPWQSAAPRIYPIASDRHRRFFMVCSAYDHQLPTEARIYEFRVTKAGQVGGYALIPGGKLGAVSVGQMAVSSSGSELAVIVSPPGTGPAATPRSTIVVINTRTGVHATWRNARTPARFRIFDVSFVGDGRELVFLGTTTCVPGNYRVVCAPGIQQVQALTPAASGGLLNSGRILLLRTGGGTARRWITDAAISADGSTLTIVTTSVPRKPQPSTVTVSQVRVGTRKQRIIYQIHGSSGLDPEYFFSADAAGRHFLINAGPFPNPVHGWIHHSRLVTLKPPGIKVFYEAW